MTDPARTVRIDFAPQTKGYDILIGRNLLPDTGALIRARLGERRCVIVTDETVARHHLKTVEESVQRAGHTLTPSILVPPGEGSKSLPGIHDLTNQLFERAPDRGLLLIALGGGVIGDLSGFAASILLRGIDFVQIPTTLLAQVDSSVGGKTGINSVFGKNTIGTFYQPRLVIADVDALQTLPERERLAGYAETVKYGLLMDAPFFEWCRANGKRVIAGEPDALIEAVSKSCAFKAQIVAEDEREGGKRALLNFGHTFAHPLESVTGYGNTLLHGEAVAIGMAMAFDLSAKMGLCPADDAETVRAHFAETGLPVKPPKMNYNIEDLMALMAQDKKARDGALTLILARGIGQAFTAKNVDPEPVRTLWWSYI